MKLTRSWIYTRATKVTIICFKKLSAPCISEFSPLYVLRDSLSMQCSLQHFRCPGVTPATRCDKCTIHTVLSEQNFETQRVFQRRVLPYHSSDKRSIILYGVPARHQFLVPRRLGRNFSFHRSVLAKEAYPPRRYRLNYRLVDTRGRLKFSNNLRLSHN